MSLNYKSSKRIPYSQWMLMTPAQRAARTKGTYRKPLYVKVKKTYPSMLKTPLFNETKWARMRYNEVNVAFNIGTPNATGYVFTANGLYDPNITSVGHQPLGFDQMMLIYEHYTVTKAKITVTFTNLSSNPIYVALYISPDGTILTDPNQIVENGQIKKTYLEKVAVDGATKTLVLYCDIAKENGIKSVLLENDYRGTIAANPVEQSYFVLAAWDPFSGVGASVQATALIEYTARFTEPKKLTTS